MLLQPQGFLLHESDKFRNSKDVARTNIHPSKFNFSPVCPFRLVCSCPTDANHTIKSMMDLRTHGVRKSLNNGDAPNLKMKAGEKSKFVHLWTGINQASNNNLFQKYFQKYFPIYVQQSGGRRMCVSHFETNAPVGAWRC